MYLFATIIYSQRKLFELNILKYDNDFRYIDKFHSFVQCNKIDPQDMDIIEKRELSITEIQNAKFGNLVMEELFEWIGDEYFTLVVWNNDGYETLLKYTPRKMIFPKHNVIIMSNAIMQIYGKDLSFRECMHTFHIDYKSEEFFKTSYYSDCFVRFYLRYREIMDIVHSYLTNGALLPHEQAVKELSLADMINVISDDLDSCSHEEYILDICDRFGLKCQIGQGIIFIRTSIASWRIYHNEHFVTEVYHESLRYDIDAKVLNPGFHEQRIRKKSICDVLTYIYKHDRNKYS